MIRIGITGSNGQLGQSFQSIASDFPEIDFEFYSSSDWDITDESDVPPTLEALDVLINCAAYTQVDKAESEPGAAYLVNAEAVGILARHCHTNAVHFIHFSSDYVYHNDREGPLREVDPTKPKGVYARSKLAGEEVIRQHCDNHLIFRVSWLYGPFGHNFPKTMVRLSKTRSSFRIVNDQWGAPTNTVDLARMVLSLLKPYQSFELVGSLRGTYNFANLGYTTWDQIARLVFDEIGRNDIVIEAIPSREYPTPAERPLNSRLDLSKFLDTWDWPIPKWEDSMRRTIAKVIKDSAP